MSIVNSTADSVVPVPVPVQHLPAVYKLLAELTAASPASASNVNVTSPDELSILIDESQGSWTQSMIGRLHASLNLEGARLMLDLVAEAAPEEVAMQDGVKAWGHTYGHLRAQMGALSKLTKKFFGKKTWPMHVRYDEQGQAFYSMPKEVADWWKAEGGAS